MKTQAAAPRAILFVMTYALIAGASSTAAASEPTTRPAPAAKSDAATQPARKPVDTKILEQLWQQLCGENSDTASQTADKLAALGDPAVDFIATQIEPTEANEKHITALIADLDSDKWKVRKQATEELKKIGFRAGPLLRDVLESKPSLEAELRIKAILAGLDDSCVRIVRTLALVCSTRAVGLLEKTLSAASEDAKKRAKEELNSASRKYYRKGWNQKKDGEYTKAIKSLDKAIILRHDYVVAYVLRGNAYSIKGQIDKSIADYTKATELSPNYALAYTNRGKAYNNKKQYKKAMADLNKAIELAPKKASSYHSRGITYYYLKQYDESIADYTKAIQLNPKSAMTYRSRGLSYAKNKLQDKAIADYTKAIQLHPNYSDAYHSRAIAYRAKKLYDSAIADYTKLIALRPNDAAAYCARGGIYEKQKLYVKAIADCKKAVSLNPNWTQACNDLAWLYVICPDKRHRNPPESLRLARNAVKQHRDFGYLDTLAGALADNGKFEQAVSAQQEAISHCPKKELKELFQRRLEGFKQGKTYLQQEEEKKQQKPEKE